MTRWKPRVKPGVTPDVEALASRGLMSKRQVLKAFGIPKASRPRPEAVYWLELVPESRSLTRKEINAWKADVRGRRGLVPGAQRILSLVAMYNGVGGPLRCRPYTVGGVLWLWRERQAASAVRAQLIVQLKQLRARTAVVVRRAQFPVVVLGVHGSVPLL